MDEQLRGIQHFIEGFDTLDDQSALGLAHQIMFTSKIPLAH
jgi:hypothetical protein